MICPKCSHHQQYKYGMKCSSCGYQFVVNPKLSRQLNDIRIKKFVEVLSENNTKYFTQNQIFGIYARKVTQGSANFFWIATVVLICVMLGLFLTENWGLGIITVFLTIVALPIIGSLSNFDTAPPINPFPKLFPRWQSQNRASTYLTKPQFIKAPRNMLESDIYQYGAENLLIVDKDIYVDLLIKNGFHQDYKTIVISENLYPKYLGNVVKKTLEKNPEMPVFLLHDGDKQGEQMLERIVEKNILGLKNHNITDLGLRYEHFKKSKFLRPYKAVTRSDFAPLDFLSYRQICHLFESGVDSGEPFTDDLIIADSHGAIMDFG